MNTACFEKMRFPYPLTIHYLMSPPSLYTSALFYAPLAKIDTILNFDLFAKIDSPSSNAKSNPNRKPSSNPSNSISSNPCLPMALLTLWPFGPYGPLDPIALWTLWPFGPYGPLALMKLFSGPFFDVFLRGLHQIASPIHSCQPSAVRYLYSATLILL